MNKHEHPTRIPTPISFSRPLLNGGSIDISREKQIKPQSTTNDQQKETNKNVGENKSNETSLDENKKMINNLAAEGVRNKLKKTIPPFPNLPNEKVSNGTAEISPSKDIGGKINKASTTSLSKDKEILTNGVSIISPSREKTVHQNAENSPNKDHKIVLNGGAGDAPTHPAPELRQPRFKISVEEINQLLNSSRSNVRKLQAAPKPARAIITEYPQTESNPFRTSGSAVLDRNRTPSAFVRVDNRPNGDAPVFSPNRVAPKKYPPSSFPSYKRYHDQVRRSASIDLNDNFAGYNGNQPKISHLTKQNSLRDTEVTQNGFEYSPTSSDTPEVYWV